MKLTLTSKMLILAVGLLLGSPLWLSSYYLGLLTQAIIFAVFAMSLDLLVGSLGLPSLGHAAYFGMGAYTAGLISLKLTNNFWLCLLAGTASGLMLAALFGFLAVRTHGASFLMITLALGQVVWGIAYKWRSFTGGDDGLSGIPLPDVNLPLAMSRVNYYYVVLVIVVILAGLLALLVRSPFGVALKGVRESETRMRALGYNTVLYKYLCFVVAGGFAGAAGVLFVFYNRFVGPANLGVVLSAKGLLMVILGGAGTLWGPALGAVIITFLEHVASAHIERWVMLMGVIYIVVVVFFPEGIVGTIKARLREG
jgi:branched-chain amino acid transport system permease protein